jgi:hypothetical protein
MALHAMTSISGVPIENPRAQCIVMLFAALHEMGGCHSKQETISYIREHHWFDIRDEDRKPYPSATTNEPRWHTLIAWGRKDAVLAELMFDHPPDQYELTRGGIQEFRLVRAQYQSAPWRPVALTCGRSLLRNGWFRHSFRRTTIGRARRTPTATFSRFSTATFAPESDRLYSMTSSSSPRPNQAMERTATPLCVHAFYN